MDQDVTLLRQNLTFIITHKKVNQGMEESSNLMVGTWCGSHTNDWWSGGSEEHYEHALALRKNKCNFDDEVWTSLDGMDNQGRVFLFAAVTFCFSKASLTEDWNNKEP